MISVTSARQRNTFTTGEDHAGATASDLPTWSSQTERVHLLSSRELQVFFLLGAGKSNRVIALAMGITERTVKAHVTSMMAKLQVESRLQAGLAAYTYQLTTPQGIPWQGG